MSSEEDDRLILGETERIMRREQLDAASDQSKEESTINMPLPGDATPTEPDLVNHPPHYGSHPSGVECIRITRHMSFDLGNAMKYIWRAGNKDSASEEQDIAKAIWYLQDHLKMLRGEI